MTTDNTDREELERKPPERVWVRFEHFRSRSILVGEPSLEPRSANDIEYVRAAVAAPQGDALKLLGKFVRRIQFELRDDPALLSHPAWQNLIGEANALISSPAAPSLIPEQERHAFTPMDNNPDFCDKCGWPKDDCIQRFAATPATATSGAREAEREFLAASVAVWREIDRLSALPEGYKGLAPETDPRKRELAAWENYRTVLDAAPAAVPVEEQKVEKFADSTKVVRSKDVLDAIDATVSPINRQQIRGGEVGLLIYQRLAAVQEFYAKELTPATGEAK